MKGSHIITINGRAYDAITGMPVAQERTQRSAEATAAPQPSKEPTSHKRPSPPVHKPLRAFNDVAPSAAKSAAQPTAAKPKTPAQTIHRQPQKSQTLHPALRRPAARPRPATPQPTRPVQHRSPAISKFAPIQAQEQAATDQPTQPMPAATKPKVHPVVAKAIERQRQKATAATVQVAPVAQSSKELKEMLIKERLAEVDTHDKKKERRGFMKRRPRLTTILTSTLVTLLLGGYLVYMNLPNISMRVAATRAGISANFPDYKPDGYSFQGPITYSPGEVNVNFKSNTNGQSFTLKQKSSNWDSQAVLDNYVTKQTDTYLTYQERGLTIYSFDNKAAWVNGGLLYSIEGNTQLSGEQILRIATSM